MLINIDQIKITDRIRNDFGNIQELAEDIQNNGLINPPVVTPDTFELIAGERRLKAMQLLGYKQIEIRPMAVKDAEHQLNLEISENETRKDFSKSERIDYARRLERIERVKAERRKKLGVKTPRQNSDEGGRTDDIVSEKLRIGSRDTYRKEKYITDNKASLTPEDFADWDEGKLSTNKVYQKVKQQIQEKDNQIAGYVLKLQNAQNQQTKIIDKTDYTTIDNLKSQVSSKDKDILKLRRDIDLLEKKVKLNQTEADKYNELKKSIDFLTKQREDISREIQATTELSGLVVEIDNVLKTKLAPIKYSRVMEQIDNEIAKNNLIDIVESVQSWCDEMKKIYKNKNYIIVEEIN